MSVARDSASYSCLFSPRLVDSIRFLDELTIKEVAGICELGRKAQINTD